MMYDTVFTTTTTTSTTVYDNIIPIKKIKNLLFGSEKLTLQNNLLLFDKIHSYIKTTQIQVTHVNIYTLYIQIVLKWVTLTFLFFIILILFFKVIHVISHHSLISFLHCLFVLHPQAFHLSIIIFCKYYFYIFLLNSLFFL